MSENFRVLKFKKTEGFMTTVSTGRFCAALYRKWFVHLAGTKLLGCQPVSLQVIAGTGLQLVSYKMLRTAKVQLHSWVRVARAEDQTSAVLARLHTQRLTFSCRRLHLVGS